MSTAPRERMSVAAYLEFERASEERHEYIDGEIFAMSGASYAHNVLVSNLVYELRRALDGRPCRPLANDMRVRAGMTRYVYPTSWSCAARPSSRTATSCSTPG